MQMVYDHYEILSLGIVIGPVMLLLGLFLLKKRKRLSRALIALGIIYFSISAILVYRFVQGEKDLAKQREHAQKSDSKSNTSFEEMDAQLAKESYDSNKPLASLGHSYSFKKTAKQFEIRYCPDNTCEVILSPKRFGKDVADDFSFLYFSTTSDYESIKSYQKAVPENDIDKVKRKYQKLCTEKLVSPKCILNGMIQKYSIKLQFSRFDENKESMSDIKL